MPLRRLHPDSTTGAGTVSVNQDGKSGLAKVDLLRGEHVEGSWVCDQVTPE